MSIRKAVLAPDAAGRDRARWPALLAVVLAAVGLAVNVVRPLAPTLPGVTTDLATFTPAVLATIEEYRQVRYAAGALSLALTVLVPLLLVATSRGRRLIERVAGPAERSARRAALVGVVVTLLTAVVRFPLQVAIGFVYERDWGFLTAPLGLWLRDLALAVGGQSLVAGVGAAALVFAIWRWPRSWPWRLTIAGTAAAAVLILAHPLVIQPLTLTTTPLPPGALRTQLEQVLARAGEHDLELLVGDASTRSTRVNAFVTGIGPTRQVVLYDTLLELSSDEVAMIVAHELAHREHRDIPRGVLLTATALLPVLLLLRTALRSAGTSATLGLRSPHDPRAIAFVAAVAAVAQVVGMPIASAVSRRAEAAADFRALELSQAAEPLVVTARTFVVRDLAAPAPPTWVRVLWGSHPTATERISTAAAYAQARDLPLPDLQDLREAEEQRRHPRIPEDE